MKKQLVVHDMAAIDVFRQVHTKESQGLELVVIKLSWHNDGNEIDENIDMTLDQSHKSADGVSYEKNSNLFLTIGEWEEISEVVHDMLEEIRLMAKAIVALDIKPKVERAAK